MDSQNFPGFDRGRMEGRLEMLLSRRVAHGVFLFFIGFTAIAGLQLWNLQVVRGEELSARAFNNRMEIYSLLPERGVIVDSRGIELAWNEAKFRIVLHPSSFDMFASRTRDIEKIFGKIIDIDAIRKYITETSSDIILADNMAWEEAERIVRELPDIPFRIESSSIRRYTGKKGFSHLIGYVGYSDELDGETQFSPQLKVGKTGIEKYFNTILGGKKGTRIAEVDAHGKIISQHLQENPKSGETLALTIDAELQSKLYDAIGQVVEDRGFTGAAGAFLNIKNGDVLALTSYPEFDSNTLSQGLSKEEFEKISTDPRSPFFFRALEGRYPPGSIFKPIVALAALEEGIISPEKEIYSSGRIVIPNPYNPNNPSIFLDWKAHGWVDMRQALAVSSNVYFYSLGGGYEDQKGLGAIRLKKYSEMFGLGKPVLQGVKEEYGAVPDPLSNSSWTIGDTYNFSIGQGGLQVTPLQIARYAALLAQDGIFPDIHLLKNQQDSIIGSAYITKEHIPISQKYFSVIKEGMRKAVEAGTAQAAAGVGMKIAGKTGTAEIGNGRVDSWFIGFFPYEDPKIAFAVVLENGSEKNLIGAPFATRSVLEWIARERPEYIK